jgi:hypothetical protein
MLKRLKRLKTDHQHKERITAKKLYESIQRVNHESDMQDRVVRKLDY